MIIWTIENIEKLADLAKQPLTAVQIGQEFGCSRNAIINQCGKNGILLYYSKTLGNKPPSSSKVYAPKWREDETKKLISLVKKGYSKSEIATLMNRSFESIDSRCRHLKLNVVRKEKPAKTKKAQRKPEILKVGYSEPLSMQVIKEGAKALIDLRNCDCAWPVANGFCADPVTSGSYCGLHTVLSRGKEKAPSQVAFQAFRK